MTLDNITGITEGSYTGFCKSQLITCNRVKECNGVCPFEDALKHADREQSLNEQNIDHDREWIIGCIKHDGFIKTDRFDKANQIIIEALSADAVHGEWVRKYDDAVNCYWYECNQCGEYKPRNQFGNEYNANYCPNCGAIMDKGGEEECV